MHDDLTDEDLPTDNDLLTTEDLSPRRWLD